MDIIVFYYLCERLHLKSTQNKLNTTYRLINLINFQKIVNELTCLSQILFNWGDFDFFGVKNPLLIKVSIT